MKKLSALILNPIQVCTQLVLQMTLSLAACPGIDYEISLHPMQGLSTFLYKTLLFFGASETIPNHFHRHWLIER